MIIALFIFAIGILPLVLAINVLRIYKGTEIGVTLLWFMTSITLWQFDIGVLYLKGILPEEFILQLFRLFRLGPIGVVPITFYLIYLILKKHATNIRITKSYQFFQFFFNRKIIWLFIIWSLFVYCVMWSSLGITELKEVTLFHSHTEFYFPVYGKYHIIYLFHLLFIFILLIIAVICSRSIQNITLKSFLLRTSYCSMFLLLAGLINFIPGTGAIVGSIGVIIFSSIIVFAFVKLNNLMTINYNLLIERQKKLDYLGNISTSLIHEVKNNLQIIKAYAKMLPETTQLPPDGERMVKMIQVATKQLEDLTQNYSEYLHKKSIHFTDIDLNEIIDETIDLTVELTKNARIFISFDKKYKHLKAYASAAYLKQVFINLIKNSCEAIAENSQQGSITIVTDIISEKIIIDIIDSGHEIPFEEWESIFDPFFSSKSSGMGVGLPFVRNIIFEHRGEIFILDSSSKGTTIRIILPQYEFSDFSDTM
jgi:signal transduction histidine kinase